MAKIFGILIFITTLVAFMEALGQINYCKMTGCKEPHTMCQFKPTTIGRACGKMESNKLTEKDKNEILSVHNMFRAKVASGSEKLGNPGPQPKGKIPPLKWDNELATVAQRWANQCTVKHVGCRSTSLYENVGQNIAYKGHSGGWTSMTELITMWYDEVKIFNKNNVRKFVWRKEIGHYTQLVWGKTTHVGCGVAKFKSAPYWNTILVCNYGPSGNWDYLPIY